MSRERGAHPNPMAFGKGKSVQGATPSDTIKNQIDGLFQRSTSMNRPKDRVFVRFRVFRFLRVLIYHYLFPFSIPLVIYIDGFRCLKNMQMWFTWGHGCLTRLLFLWNSWITPLLLWIVSIWFFTGGADMTKGGPFEMEIVIVHVYCFIRSVTVALKYAYMPASVWHNFKSKSGRDAVMKMQNENQLLSAWVNPSALILQREMLDAAARSRIDFNTMVELNDKSPMFEDIVETIPPAMASYLGYTRTGKNRLQFPIGWVGTYVMARAAHTGNPMKAFMDSTGKFALPVALIHTAQPIWQHIELTEAAEPVQVLMSVLVAVPRLWWYWVLFMFLVAALHDYVRTALVHQIMFELISPSAERAVKETDNFGLKWTQAVIDVTNPERARAWFKLRRVLKQTGSRFQLRLQGFIAFSLVLLVFMLIMSFASVFAGGGLAAILAPEIVLTLQLTMYNLILVAVAVLGMIGLGDYANEYTQMQIGALVEREMELGEAEHALRSLGQTCTCVVSKEMVQERFDTIRESLSTLHQIRRALKIEDRFTPVCILGVRADRFLLQSIGIGAFSLIAVASRVILAN